MLYILINHWASFCIYISATSLIDDNESDFISHALNRLAFLCPCEGSLQMPRPVDLIEMFIREHSFLPHQWIIHKGALWRPCVFCQGFLSWNRSVVEILSDPLNLLQLGGFKWACNSFWQMALRGTHHLCFGDTYLLRYEPQIAISS